jgi:hypothetical protein
MVRIRYSLRYILLGWALFAALCAGVLYRFTDDDRYYRIYTLRNRPAGARFTADMDAWMLRGGFQRFTPDYNRWPWQMVPSENNNGAYHAHYLSPQEPYAVEVRMYQEVSGGLAVFLSCHFETRNRLWERRSMQRRADEILFELVDWCERYPSPDGRACRAR